MSAVETDVPLSLANVQLHIESVVPRASRSSYEARKAASVNGLAHDHHHHDQEANANDDEDPQQQQAQHQRTGDAAPADGDDQDQGSAWTQRQLADRQAWLAGFKPTKTGGLVFLDRAALKKQQGVFKDVVKQVGSQLLTGKLAVRISLPIRIFEPRTLLERVADGWNYAPTLLARAARAGGGGGDVALERMKLVMAFAVGGFHFCVGQLKPFNPILGETYEAAYPDGTQVFMEHVAHHPVQSAFHVRGPRGLFELHGVYKFESVTSRNSIFNHQIGKTTVRFRDGHTITYTLPQIKMSGLLFGERVVELAGVAEFEDAQNQLTGELNFDANRGGFLFGKSQADDIRGHIVSTTRRPNEAKPAAANSVVAVQGSWLTHLQCDGKVYWHVETEPAFAHEPVANPLPSDCRYREDLVALQRGDLELAQAEKLRLEELQRSDRKLRDGGAHNNTPGKNRRASKC